MVELYWPRNTTFSRSTPSGLEKYQPGLHDIDDDRVERFKERGWVDPDDDDVDVEIEDGEDETETAEIVMNDGQEEEEEVELEEDELSLSPNEDDGEDEFDAEEFVDRTPQKDVIVDLESGEYDDRLDAIESAESDGRDRRGVERAIAERREANDDSDSDDSE